MKRCMLLATVLVAVASGSAFGQGMLVPTDKTLPPLAIKSQKVSVNIENQVATTTIEQVFVNSTSRQLEANYVFPVPPGATMRDFAMIVDGKRTSGELVEAAKAKQIYQQIVAQARDPGLLEHLGDNLFRVNIFPVPANGTQTVELSFSQVVPGSGGVFRYVYPLKTGGKASQVQDFFSVGVKLSSKTPIKSVYSPTHDVGVSRKDDHHAVVGMEISRAMLDRDFSLYWTVSEKDFGLNAVTYRPDEKQPGYLMLLISPKSAVNSEEIIAKDVLFVFDTSGSMSTDEKIQQAKKALRFCVDKLNAKDRFNIVTFATDVTPYKDKLVSVAEAGADDVRDYINRLEANGGTNIYGALDQALKMAKASDGRPRVIVFLTDGKPTIDRTGTDEILSLLGPGGKPDKDSPRVFVFGVGNDVNTHLLDKLAQSSGGTSEYVKPGEDIEVKVSDFFAKASHPVMTDLQLAFGGDIKIDQMYPRELGDLYFGQQIVAFGRYDGSGDVSVTLSGKVSNGKSEKHTYEVTLAKQTTDNNFIEPLWAHRKVGYLLDQIRLNGENEELKGEVIRLSKQYKIQTPYTSYLVLEEQHRKQYLGDGKDGRLAQQGGQGGGAPGGPGHGWNSRGGERPAEPMVRSPSATPAPASETASRGGVSSRDRSDAKARLEGEVRRSLDGIADSVASSDDADGGPLGREKNGFGLDKNKWSNDVSGAGAVELSEKLKEMKKADQLRDPEAQADSRQIAGRSFYRVGGLWVDERFNANLAQTRVKWGSEAFFAIVAAHEELKDVFALGERLVIVTAEGKALVIGDSGEEKLSGEQIAELFKPAPTTQPEAK